MSTTNATNQWDLLKKRVRYYNRRGLCMGITVFCVSKDWPWSHFSDIENFKKLIDIPIY